MQKKRKNGSIKPFDDQMRQAVQMMFDGARIGRIAAEIGVHRTTIWRWYNRKDFRREYDRLQRQFVHDMRRKIKKEIRESPEYKQALAARRRLSRLGKKIEEAGNRGDLNAYRKAAADYDRCMKDAFPVYFGTYSSQKINTNRKASKPKRYIVEIVN